MKKPLGIIVLTVMLIAAGCNNTNSNSNSQTPLQTNNGTQQAEQKSPEVASVKIALIALDDNGKRGKKIGCDDSVVLVDRVVPPTTQPLTAAFKALFSLGTHTIKPTGVNPEFHNSLYEVGNTTTFEKAEVVNGVAMLYFTGSLGSLVGGVCDSPRVVAQIEETARQFPSVTSIKVFENGTETDWKNFGSEK
jgi:hypothetical protein